jgi:hypothetical protein
VIKSNTTIKYLYLEVEFMSRINTLGNTNYLLSGITKQSSKTSGNDSRVTSSESSKVSLSEDAKVLATFASKGISVSLKQMSNPLNSQSESRNSDSFVGTDEHGKSISKDDLDKLLFNLGATDLEREQIKSGLDNNKDETISHEELLKGIASTLGANSLLGQAILSIMDRNGDSNGAVTPAEFARITTAFNDTEK